MPPCIQRNQIEMHQEICHSESMYISTFLSHGGMPQKQSHKCKPRRIICKRIGLSQVKIFKLCKNTEVLK